MCAALKPHRAGPNHIATASDGRTALMKAGARAHTCAQSFVMQPRHHIHRLQQHSSLISVAMTLLVLCAVKKATFSGLCTLSLRATHQRRVKAAVGLTVDR